MPEPAYSLGLNDLFTHHGLKGSGLVHDADLHLNQLQVEALAASGDCFVTLASEIDNLSETFQTLSSNNLKLELEKLASILLYLQQHYEVKRKIK